MRNLIYLFLLVIIHFGCASSKPITSKPGSNTRSLMIMYDQNIREWPLKNPTNMVIPGIYLPLQKKAFQLDRTEIWARKILILQFSGADTSSLVQVMANRFGYKNWLYTDSLLSIKHLPATDNCYKLDISTFKSKDFGLVPQLTLIPFACNVVEVDYFRDRFLIYDVATLSIIRGEEIIYRKKGYNALFSKPFIPKSPIIKVSDVIK